MLLCERLLDGAAAREGACAEEDDDGKHQGEDDPADPGESHERLGRVAVRERVGLGAAAERAAGAVSEGSGTGEPEDPGEEERDAVAGDRSDDAADAGKEETGLFLSTLVREQDNLVSVNVVAWRPGATVRRLRKQTLQDLAMFEKNLRRRRR